MGIWASLVSQSCLLVDSRSIRDLLPKIKKTAFLKIINQGCYLTTHTHTHSPAPTLHIQIHRAVTVFYVNLKYTVENLCCGRRYINLCFFATVIGTSIQEGSNPKKN